ncbi:hypothetical protein [Candidatus Hodarchaeum mangrovi]
MSEKKKTRSIFDKIKESGKEFVDGVKEEIDMGTISTKEKAREYTARKSSDFRETVRQRSRDTSSPEELYFSAWNWFCLMIFGVFFSLIIFIFSLGNPKFLLVGLLALIAIPFIVIWCLTHMVPTIKIFGFTVFDRDQLSVRRQLSIGKEIARFFSREFLQESPMIAFFIFLFILIFILALMSAIVTP